MRLLSFAVGDYVSFGAVSGDRIVDVGRLLGEQHRTLGAIRDDVVLYLNEKKKERAQPRADLESAKRQVTPHAASEKKSAAPRKAEVIKPRRAFGPLSKAFAVFALLEAGLTVDDALEGKYNDAAKRGVAAVAAICAAYANRKTVGYTGGR